MPGTPIPRSDPKSRNSESTEKRDGAPVQFAASGFRSFSSSDTTLSGRRDRLILLGLSPCRCRAAPEFELALMAPATALNTKMATE